MNQRSLIYLLAFIVTIGSVATNIYIPALPVVREYFGSTVAQVQATFSIALLTFAIGMLFWGWLWGPAGALLSVPILAATKIVLENIPDLAWIAELADPRDDNQSGRHLEAAASERVGLGLGAHERKRRKHAAHATLPGFPLKRGGSGSADSARHGGES